MAPTVVRVRRAQDGEGRTAGSVSVLLEGLVCGEPGSAPRQRPTPDRRGSSGVQAAPGCAPVRALLRRLRGERRPRPRVRPPARVDKHADVAALVAAGGRWSDIEAEIAKCDVRCASCHRRITCERRGDWRAVLAAQSLASSADRSGERPFTRWPPHRREQRSTFVDPLRPYPKDVPCRNPCGAGQTSHRRLPRPRRLGRLPRRYGGVGRLARPGHQPGLRRRWQQRCPVRQRLRRAVQPGQHPSPRRACPSSTRAPPAPATSRPPRWLRPESPRAATTWCGSRAAPPARRCLRPTRPARSASAPAPARSCWPPAPPHSTATAEPPTPAQPDGARIVDLVGFGGANAFEGTGPAPGLSSATAAVRALGGCTDANNADFAAATQAPRNATTAPAPCGTTPVALRPPS